MELLTLADLKGLASWELKNHIASVFEIPIEDLDEITILIAYESVGSFGCDSSNWFLFLKDSVLYEVAGSHCSCDGFEGQWDPQETNAKYLKSKNFHISTGGYDDLSEENIKEIKEYFKRNYA